jgi:A/G-specific adenine glycosylase
MTEGINIDIDFLHSFVIQWFIKNGRVFPWRLTKNPYNIFIAEALLRRTKADIVVAPYLELIKRFPTPYHLSDADISKLRDWFQPLGLVRRADQIVSAAKAIVEEHRGIVPNKLDELMALPGIGVYSGRAIACLAFDAVVPMIDESSGRLLRRLFRLSLKGPAYSDKKLRQIAEKIIPKNNARDFNLGLLDIAYYYCKPLRPNCASCPLYSNCSYAALTQ